MKQKWIILAALAALFLSGTIIFLPVLSPTIRETITRWVPANYSLAAEEKLVAEIRKRIDQKSPVSESELAFRRLFEATSFPKNFYGFSMTVYEPGKTRLLILRKSHSAYRDFLSVINRMIESPKAAAFDFSDTEKTRLQLDFLLSAPRLYDFKNASMNALDNSRFEIGVDGFFITDGKTHRYFLPGDAFVHSILGKNQFLRHLSKYFDKDSMKNLNFYRFRAHSYVTFGRKLLPLFRGYPLVGSITRKDLEMAAGLGVQYVRKFQKPNGQFLYYYDAARDSLRDHEHPTRDPQTNPYYNILRHAGGAILYMYYYRLYHDDSILEPARRAIDYLLKQSVAYQLPDGQEAAYIFYNRKAKLGGSGLALYLLSEYTQLTQDRRYVKQARLLKNHLLSEIRESGEFYYYTIYPGRKKEDPRSFSFYYPGEALVGLATYDKYIAAQEEKPLIEEKIRRAMDFLLLERPKLYRRHFTTLPSDSWLMMAVNEMWDIPGLRENTYRDFVFADADKMVRLQYTRTDSLFPDYVGSFYYRYGDHPYPDGARCEGLTAAWQLAVKSGSGEHEKRYYEALKSAAWATLHLVNTPESVYSVPRPDRTIGGIRFKLTRQWFRVDTIQHVASFYLKFIPGWKEGDVFEMRRPLAMKISET